MATRSEVRTVSDTVGETLVALGVDTLFTLIGSSNLPYTDAVAARGATVHRGRQETAVVLMATAWAQVSGRVGVCTINQGPALTHAASGLVEAHKSHTPVLVVASDTPARATYSSPGIAQDALVASLGVAAERVHAPETAAADVERAYRRAERTLRPVVLMVSTAVQRMPAAEATSSRPVAPEPSLPGPDAATVSRVADVLAGAERPVLLAGRGVVHADARADAVALADRVGALLLTSALAHGLFGEHPFALGISGGYATPHALELLAEADVVIALGASLNDWTTRAGSMFPAAQVVQVDRDPDAFGRHHRVDVPVLADVAVATRALVDELATRGDRAGYRSDDLARAIATRKHGRGRWDDQDGRVHPAALTRALDDLLPRDRTIVTDAGGGFMDHAVRLSPPDAAGWVFPLTYMCLGLGLACAIGAAVARPDRITVAAVGDAGASMALSELETLVRLNPAILLVIYNDAAHGGEIGHFRESGFDLDLLRFPDFDFAAVARAAGAAGITVRALEDLAPIEDWLRRPAGPLVVDAKTFAAPGETETFSAHAEWSERLLANQGL